MKIPGAAIKKWFSLRPEEWECYVGALAVGVVIGFYNYLFCFSFLPLTEGWFSAYSHLIIDGKVPYRDFYLYLTPFYPMALSSLIWLFGESFFVLRMVGVVISIAIALLLYLIISKRFSVQSSVLATITACVYYESGVAFIPYDFTQVLTLLTLAVIWQFVKMVPVSNINDEPSWKSPIVRHSIFAGIFATLAFLTKQSNGAFVAVAAAFCFLYLAAPFGKKCWRMLVAYVIGSSIPLVIMLFWLLYEHALGPFWAQIFGGALAAKGSFVHIALSWIGGLLTPVYVTQIITIAKYGALVLVISIAIKIALKKLDRPIPAKSSVILFTLGFSIISALVIGASYDGANSLGGLTSELGLQVNNYIIPITTLLAALLLIMAFCGFIFPNSRRLIKPQLIVIGIMSCGMIWGNGTSAGLSEISVFTLLAVVIAALLEYNSFRYLGFFSAIILSITLILTFSSRKFEAPYTWWGVSEPDVREASYSSNVPIARGLKMSRATAENINQLSKSINSGAQEGDIFAFPNIPMVYLIAHRWPHSKIVVPWFDFLPDSPAKVEAQRLLASPPETIANLNLPAVAWEAHERLFRRGRPLGQRDILSAIRELTLERKLYRLVFSREVSPGCMLNVWKKIL